MMNQRLASGAITRICDRLESGEPITPQEIRQFRAIAEKLKFHMLENCRSCRNEMASVGPVVAQNQRRRWFLRLLVARFTMDAPDGTMPRRIPRGLIAGYESFLIKILGRAVYDELNERAGTVLKAWPNCSDRELWERTQSDPVAHDFSLFAMCRLMLRFQRYEKVRDIYINTVDAFVSGRRLHFGRRNFDFVFHHLFDPIVREIDEPGAMRRLEKELGSDALGDLHEVWVSYMESRMPQRERLSA